MKAKFYIVLRKLIHLEQVTGGKSRKSVTSVGIQPRYRSKMGRELRLKRHNVGEGGGQKVQVATVDR
jgi:hypothetical protein